MLSVGGGSSEGWVILTEVVEAERRLLMAKDFAREIS